MSKLKELLDEISNTKDVENLELILPGLGRKINKLRQMAISADSELDLLHSCLTELYDKDCNADRIRQCLDDIETL